MNSELRRAKSYIIRESKSVKKILTSDDEPREIEEKKPKRHVVLKDILSNKRKMAVEKLIHERPQISGTLENSLKVQIEKLKSNMNLVWETRRYLGIIVTIKDEKHKAILDT